MIPTKTTVFVKLICFLQLLITMTFCYAGDWQKQIISDNFKAVDSLSLYSDSGHEAIRLYQKEGNFAKALGYPEKAVFLTLSIALTDDSGVSTTAQFIDSNKPIYISMDNGINQKLQSTDFADEGLKAMQILFVATNPQESCGLMEALIHSKKFTISYQQFDSPKKVNINFTTPEKNELIYELFKLDQAKDCLKSKRSSTES
ncbi:hypothetical protein OSH00_04255 [Acinetobacter sp. A-IN1]|uniref:Uncharacterized protein n=2 Tax=Acinetobacter nematophilus TaxID=2994642 RepID=A0A9X3DS30_9GAMM|nr:hypothetical protein [Acinetobacter nematophilus]